MNFLCWQRQSHVRASTGKEKASLKSVTLSAQHLNLKTSLMIDIVVSISGSAPEGEVNWFNASDLLY